MRRLTLSTKMLMAALPLVVATAALLTFSVRGDLADIDRAENGAELGGLWEPLIGALSAVEHESDPANAGDNAARRSTDAAVNNLRDEAVGLGAAEAAGDHITSSRSALSAARRNLDMVTIAPDLQVEVDPAEAYAEASRELVAVGQLLPSEAGDPELGRELLAVVKLAEAKLAADNIIADVREWQDDPSDVTPLNAARDEFAELTTVLGEFEAIAPDEWATDYRQAGFNTALAGFRSQLNQVVRSVEAGESATYDTTDFENLVAGGVQFQTQVSQSIVDRAEAEADATTTATWRRIGIVLGAALLAALITWLISRSITRRIRDVANAANQVTTEQLPALVESLRDPRGSASLPAPTPISARGDDELAGLAGAFNSMQTTLADVARQQIDVLRRGVSDIFVTMARRNRSLIDRQLALLDELEAEIDDPEILANYYRLDHMATRMRRNSESLLVLASAEPKRRRVKATEVDDVVRAAIGEIEDYRRIEIEALEPLHVRGNVVADVAHLLAELLDNATSFSPPDTLVRVGGRRSADGYMIRIVDSGVGIGTERLRELNDLLCNPPVVGLAVESTLGMSVVSLLSNKRGIQVSLAAGNPGLIVDVVLPTGLFGEPDQHGYDMMQPVVVPDSPAGIGIDAGSFGANLGSAPRLEAADTVETTIGVIQGADDERPVTTSDWRAMSLNLAAFQSGVQSATGAATDEVADPEPAPDASVAPEPAAIAEPTTTTEPEPVVAPEPVALQPTTTPEPVVAPEPVALQPTAIPELTMAAKPSVAAEPSAPEPDTAPEPIALQPTVAAEPSAPEPTSAPEPVGSTEPIPEPPAPSTDEPTMTSALEASLAQVTSAPKLPPPAERRTSEFEVPPAPPRTPDGPSVQPVTPEYARPAPPIRGDSDALIANLPTRLPGDGPDGGPDRLATMPTPAAGARLPSRDRFDEPTTDEERPDAAPLDPDALRDRLRSFQAEFRSALDGDGDVALPPDRHDTNDLGGDRR